MDERFTKITSALLLGVRDLAEWGIESRNTSPELLQWAVSARRELAIELFKSGMKQKDIAKKLGCSEFTVSNDLREYKLSIEKPKEIKDGELENLTSTGSAATKKHRAKIAKQAAEKGVTEAPKDKYRIIYADPPWSYGNTQPDYHTEQRDHYPVMELKEICSMPIKEWAEDNAVLFLWVTSPILAESFEVIEAWGFKYKASFVWDKIEHNMGHYNSVRHELLLICTRGSCQPDVRGSGLRLVDSVQSIARKAHSEKPLEFFDIIESLYTHGKRIQIFGRKERDGWTTYGHVAEIKNAAA